MNIYLTVFAQRWIEVELHVLTQLIHAHDKLILVENN